MSSDYNTKVFDISHLNTVSGSEEDIGATLGLFLCKQYVDLHGGKIWAETEKGKSSEFKFTLPLKSRK
jgi:signal transduction histidine kinase